MQVEGVKGWLIERIPYSHDYEIRNRVDELFSREMLGAVLVGKFVGDYTAITATDLLGTDIGYILGILLTITLFVYWEHIEQQAKAKKDKISNSQSQLSDFDAE